MTSKSSPPYSPNIIFNSFSGLTANIEIKELNIMLGLYGGEDLDVIFNTVIFISKWEINIASISFIMLFTEGHLKNRCCIVSSLSLIWQRWHLPFDKFIFFNLCSVYDKLQFLNESNTIISPDKLKIKVIQGIFKQNIKPKCQIKWEEQYGGNIDWTQIWTKLKKIKVTNKVKEFQWKCLHNINYTEHRLKKMNLSNGRCHLCQIRDNDETMQHLFFKCPSVKFF
jgi:hypothetical protein